MDFLSCVPNFLFSEFYLSLFFDFTIGLSLDHSCLILSMFIIILIIRIIKIRCFHNTILMVELVGRVP